MYKVRKHSNGFWGLYEVMDSNELNLMAWFLDEYCADFAKNALAHYRLTLE